MDINVVDGISLKYIKVYVSEKDRNGTKKDPIRNKNSINRGKERVRQPNNNNNNNN